MAQRSRTRRGLGTWLAESTTPLFLLDARRKVLFFNHGCEVLTGWEAGDVIGQVCDYVSEPDHEQVESLTGSLCPPPEVLEGCEQSVPTFIVTRDGEQHARTTRFVPLLQENGSIDRVLGMIMPLDEPAPTVPNSPDRQLHAELAAIRADLRKQYDVTSLVGQSAVFRRVLRQVDVARNSSVPVHFCGEPGTGREHLARLIHYHGPSRRHAFVPIDCARLTAEALTETLQRVLRDSGEEDTADIRPGTLLVKNVDHLPADLQQLLVDYWSSTDTPKLLRLISDSVDSLEDALAADVLSEECFQLLNSLVIHLPPLRERMDDFPLLAQDMLERDNRDRESQVTGFSEDVWTAFRRYRWPGNQQELQAVIREARAGCTGKLITLDDLPFRFRTGQQAQRTSPASLDEIVSLEQRLADVEREHIHRALEASRYNKSQAAQSLGITRQKLYRRMQDLGLSEPSDNP